MKNITALIVDDMEVICDSMSETLQNLGVTNIHVAYDGDSAVSLFKKLRIDLVFMDINLDGVSGLDVMQELKKIDKNLYAVILSGESSIENVRKSISLGAKGFIVKPFSTEKVEEILDTFESKVN
jgi:two-component system chemotaxis response regulator CheY